MKGSNVFMLSRRRFFSRVASLSTTAAVGLYAWRVEPHWIEFTYRDLPIRRLPAALEGRTLAFLTDLHAGPQVDDEYLLSVLRRTSALRPDLVVFGGDYLTTGTSTPPFDKLRRMLQAVPHGPLGTIGTLGNHDYGPHWTHSGTAGIVVGMCRYAGLTMLRNEVANVKGLQIAGLDDLWSGQFDLDLTMRRVDPTLPVIAVSHNPDTADEFGWKKFDSWILSGHTHGGQCKPPFLPPPVLPVVNRRYTSGEFDLSGGRKMYISRGVGHLARVRFDVRPEVTIFRLRVET
jgi:predicted MPP superfamily phosphohydrolase